LGAAAKIDHRDRNVYCLIGDAESREGQIWEACDFIADHQLTNVVAIFNCNQLGQSDWVSAQQSAEVLARKLEAFGFIVRVIDGHDPQQIARALNELHVIQNGTRALAIVARTVKGWGAGAEQGTGKHGTAVKKDRLNEVLGELDRTAADLGVSNVDVAVISRELAIPKPPTATAVQHGPIRVPGFDEMMAKMGFEDTLRKGKPLATRKAYGVALVALGQADARVVALDGDVKNSTYTEWFAERFPERYLEARIAEQNMISAAAGLSAGGKIPFCSTFAKFFTRAYDQIEMAIISGANFKMTGSHAGVTLAADGPSQMSLPDVAFFRGFCHVRNYRGQPAVRYFFASDAVEAYRCTELMANLEGCCYQRTLRADLPLLYKHDETFEVGGYKVLREGPDVVLVGSGYMVHECLKASDEMAKQGRRATVIDAYSMPLKTEGILEIAERSGRRIVTVEDNYTGGLDAEIGEAIAARNADVRLTPLCVRDLPKSGREPVDVLNYLHLGYGAIVQAAQ
jgi:transketolase